MSSSCETERCIKSTTRNSSAPSVTSHSSFQDRYKKCFHVYHIAKPTKDKIFIAVAETSL
ncbi:hypothetical protein T12_10356 [Trichinella patagoniensis]|uniref:Uncharacterized protein n=1 Tax=Trichinella patagoniensis TaxID=990121 RepID=A0A0V0Z1J7_9BILA|nr:hypothetical protein T12_10356 [Trichinella patagoniensis]